MGVLHLRIWNKFVQFSTGAIHRRRETFGIPDFYKAPSSHSDGSCILGNFSFFHSNCTVDQTQFNRQQQDISGCLYFLFEVILSVILTFCVTSMFLVVCKTRSKNCVLVKQLQFNQRFAKVKTQNSSAVKWVALVTCVFLICYGIFTRCSLLALTGHQCNDFHYKVLLQVFNSGINPIAYAFFKRDIKKECKKLLFKRCC